METRKNLLQVVGDWLAARQTSAPAAARQPGRVGALLRWFVPNGGTLLLVALLIATQSLWARPAAAPNAPGPSATTVNYQGRLADSSGVPITGTRGMTFALYDALTGGNLIWGPESHTAVPVSDGLFSVGLGSQTSGGIPTSAWNGDRYLEITVGGETLSPRELLRSVPVAGMALTVPDGAITRKNLASGAAGGWHLLDDDIVVVTLNNFSNTGNPAWETIDVSSHVPPEATALLVSIQNTADSSSVMVQVRPIGSSGGGGQIWTTIWQSGLWDSASGIVKLNTTHSFEWRAVTNGANCTGNIQIWGYYIPAP